MYRILDVNFNRTREGLRVIEEYFRFIDNNQEYTSQIKEIRHKITQLIISNSIQDKLLQARNVKDDFLAGDYTEKEGDRKDSRDVLFANFQRVKESLRVIEEYGKILDPELGEKAQELRFQVYEIEKQSSR
ncbi:hypothetical protein KKC59_00260 [bacterium]|nr:hypothetical protein [bacterium]